MKTKVCMLLICLFAIASLGLAQAKVDGKWAATIEGGRRGPAMVTIMLKAEAGGKLSGTWDQGGRGGPTMIEEGTIAGTTIKFKRKQMGRGGAGDTVTDYTGTLSGDEIKFTVIVEGGTGMPTEFTAKRAS
jgi:hypothetical protein